MTKLDSLKTKAAGIYQDYRNDVVTANTDQSTRRMMARWAVAGSLGAVVFFGMCKLVSPNDANFRDSPLSPSYHVPQTERVIPKVCQPRQANIPHELTDAIGAIPVPPTSADSVRDSYSYQLPLSALERVLSHYHIDGPLRHDAGSETESNVYARVVATYPCLIPALVTYTRSIDPEIKACAVTSLGLLAPESHVDVFIAALDTPNHNVRRNAISALGASRSSVAIPPLAAVLRDEDTSLRTDAASALGNIGTRDILIPLASRLAVELDSTVSMTIELSIEGVLRASPPVLSISFLQDTQSIRSRVGSSLEPLRGRVSSDLTSRFPESPGTLLRIVPSELVPSLRALAASEHNQDVRQDITEGLNI